MLVRLRELSYIRWVWLHLLIFPCIAARMKVEFGVVGGAGVK